MEVQPDISVAYLMIHTFRWCRCLFFNSINSIQFQRKYVYEHIINTYKYMCILLECSHVAIWSYLGSSSWTERWPEGLSDSPCLAASSGDHWCCSKGDWLKRQKASKVKAAWRGSASQRWLLSSSFVLLRVLLIHSWTQELRPCTQDPTLSSISWSTSMSNLVIFH